MVTKHEAMRVATEVNDEITTYFRALGFEVTWDFSRRTGLHWYEIYDGHEQLLQIDFGAPLADLVTDLPLLAAGKPSTCKSKWEVRDGSANRPTGLERVVQRMTCRLR